jgi:hypothetical protein
MARTEQAPVHTGSSVRISTSYNFTFPKVSNRKFSMKLNSGHSSELKVLDVIKDGIEEIWGIRRQYCSFYNRKRYFSMSRNSDIEVDISIEIKRANVRDWYQLLVFECKDLSRPVSVNEIETFKSHVDQIAGKNIKAFVVSKSGFTDGAVKYSCSNGIGLINYLDNCFDHIAENRLLIDPQKDEPKTQLEVLEGIGRLGEVRTLNHYEKSVRVELFAKYCIESSPRFHRQTRLMNEIEQCGPIENGKLEFHVSTQDDFGEVE